MKFLTCLTTAAASLGLLAPASAAVLEFETVFGSAPDTLDVLVTNTDASNAGLAAFSVSVSGDITDFEFGDLQLNTDEGAKGFSTLASGPTGDVYNLTGAMTNDLPNIIFNMALEPTTTSGTITVPGAGEFPVSLQTDVPLLLGSITYAGDLPLITSTSGAVLESENSSSAVQVDTAFTNVPEPTTAMLLGLGGIAALGRRRRSA